MNTVITRVDCIYYIRFVSQISFILWTSTCKIEETGVFGGNSQEIHNETYPDCILPRSGVGNLYHSKSHLDPFPTVKKTLGATNPL